MTKAEIPEVAPTRRTFLYGADIVKFFYLGGLSVDDKMSLQLKCRGFGVFEWGRLEITGPKLPTSCHHRCGAADLPHLPGH